MKQHHVQRAVLILIEIEASESGILITANPCDWRFIGNGELLIKVMEGRYAAGVNRETAQNGKAHSNKKLTDLHNEHLSAISIKINANGNREKCDVLLVVNGTQFGFCFIAIHSM